MPPQELVGHAVRTGWVSAHGIKNSTIQLEKVEFENYFVTVVWIYGDEVLVELLTNISVLNRIELIFVDVVASSMSQPGNPLAVVDGNKLITRKPFNKKRITVFHPKQYSLRLTYILPHRASPGLSKQVRAFGPKRTKLL